MGARAGYTLLTGIFIGVGGFLGQISFLVELIPRAVLAPILVFVALDIVIQAFEAVGVRQAPAVAFSFFPTVARLLGIYLGNTSYVPAEVFGLMMTKPGRALPELQVIVALGNGFIVTAMLWGAFLAKLIDRKLRVAAVYLVILATFSFFGIVHSARADGSMYLPWKLTGLAWQVALQFTLGYLVLAGVFLGLSYSAESRVTVDESE
jgi:AGZA family xanthine/uracil permease-like MFS transporter